MHVLFTFLNLFLSLKVYLYISAIGIRLYHLLVVVFFFFFFFVFGSGNIISS